MEQEVKGVVEAVSVKNSSVKVNGAWYGAVNNAPRFVVPELKGQAVVLRISDPTRREFAFITRDKDAAPQMPLVAHEPEISEENIMAVEPRKKVLGVTIGMAINCSTSYCNERFKEEKLTPQQWGQRVCEYADALLEEMERASWL